MPTRLTQTGAEVQDDLYKIEDIDLATEEKAGLMSPEDKTKLDNIDAEIPKKLSDLEEDSTHRTVTDTEKQTWNNKSDFSGRYQDLTGRPFIPTKTGDLVNNSGFITRLVDDLANYYLKSEVYTKAEVAALISSIQGFSVRVVDVLPTASAETMRAIYLVPSAEPQTGNTKDEWITVEDNGAYRWEQIGSTAISLDGYVTDAELTAALQDYVTSAALATVLAGKQDVIGDLSEIRAGAQAGASAYQKPEEGIPAADLSGAVQASLEKADGALQEETDPTVPAWAKAQNPPTEIFWATYGTTTASEIETAIAGGKLCIVSYEDLCCIFTRETTSTYEFAAPVNANYKVCAINKSNNVWGNGWTYMQPTLERVSTIVGNESATNRYPNTKAVADYVASKAEVFVAEYGVTTYVEIAAAITAEKICTVVRSGDTHSYILVNGDSNYMRFVATDGRYIYEVRCYSGDNHWIYSSTTLQITDNIVSSFQSTPDNTHYPSEKLVKDSLDAKADINALGKWGVVSQKQTWTGSNATGYDYTMSDIVEGTIPQANIDVALSLPSVAFNEETGYFELNGLTDISYQEMLKILDYWPISLGFMAGTPSVGQSSRSRTLIPLSNTGTINLTYAFFNRTNIETVDFKGDSISPQTTNNISNAWRLATRLKEIKGVTLSANTATAVDRAFENCYSLTTVEILDIRVSLSFAQSSRLTAESVAFMINNSYVSAGNFTITLHATAYARAIADADVQTALSNHTNVTLASA